MKNWRYKMELDTNNPDDVYISFVKGEDKKWTATDKKKMAKIASDLGLEDDEEQSYLMYADDEIETRSRLSALGFEEILPEKFDWATLLEEIEEKPKKCDECKQDECDS